MANKVLDDFRDPVSPGDEDLRLSYEDDQGGFPVLAAAVGAGVLLMFFFIAQWLC
jgi:hypothetical protein